MNLNLIEQSSIRTIADSAASFLKADMRIALSMGSTYEQIYPSWISKCKNLNLKFYPADERIVPITHPDSNWGKLNKLLLQKIADDNSLSHFSQTASDYQKLLEKDFRSEKPIFDVIYLGLGTDGHTASLFPNVRYSDFPSALETSSPNHPHKRISLSPGVLKAARELVVVVTGNSKRDVLSSIIKSKGDSPLLPILVSRSSTTFIVEKGLI
ncbi:MAG: 6-phosphogluconolactonase [Fibrobacteres bacterium]|nr:6-phosphogluconolactonase [Fibrobacterota bacterium]